jgi:hypothetical protein
MTQGPSHPDWLQYLEPPLPGDEEPEPIYLPWKWFATPPSCGKMVVSKRLFHELKQVYGELCHEMLLVATEITDVAKKFHVLIPPKKPFEHDRPTNLVYPTSFDNWYNEFHQPVRSHQFVETRRPYRR